MKRKIKLRICNNKNNCKDYQNRYFKNNNNKDLKKKININMNKKANFNNNTAITIKWNNKIMNIIMKTTKSQIKNKIMGITMKE